MWLAHKFGYYIWASNRILFWRCSRSRNYQEQTFQEKHIQHLQVTFWFKYSTSIDSAMQLLNYLVFSEQGQLRQKSDIPSQWAPVMIPCNKITWRRFLCVRIKIQHQTTVDHRDQLSNASTSTVLGSVEASGMKHVLTVLNLLLSYMDYLSIWLLCSMRVWSL